MSRKWTIQDVERVRDAGLGVSIAPVTNNIPVRYVIGIDPGKNTGFAVYDRQQKQLLEVTSLLIHQAFEQVKKFAVSRDILVRVEDARQRKFFGNTGREKLQGAGSAKRDSTIWEDFLNDQGIPFEMVAPKNNRTKVDAARFGLITGYTKRTNNHGRDAAFLCFNG